MGYKEKTEKLHEYLSGLSPLPWLELTPQSKDAADLTPEPIERNDRWHVIIRRYPEVDE